VLYAVAFNELPVIFDAEAGTLRHGHTAVLGNGVGIVRNARLCHGSPRHQVAPGALGCLWCPWRAAGQITDAPFNGYTGYQQPDVGATEFFAPRNGAPAMV
jgi:hypothetical protein